MMTAINRIRSAQATDEVQKGSRVLRNEIDGNSKQSPMDLIFKNNRYYEKDYVLARQHAELAQVECNHGFISVESILSAAEPPTSHCDPRKT